MELRKAFALACFATALGPPVWALSLRSPAKNVTLQGLRVGKTYSADALVRTLEFADTGQESIRITSHLLPPRDSELEDGYEPIPSLSWIHLEKKVIRLDPGRESKANFIVKIPDKAALEGGQYQARWTMSARGSDGNAIELNSRVLIQIDAGSDAAFEAAGRNRPPESPITLLSKEAKLDGVALGYRSRPPGRNEAVVKILNAGNRSATVVLRVRRKIPDAGVPPGFEAAPNPHFLRIGRPALRIGGNQIGIKRLRFEIPDEARYRGRKWVFLVETKTLGSPDSQAQEFLIRVTTARKDSR